MNDYYNPTANVPPEETRSNPDIYTAAEFAKVQAGFDKMPGVTSADRYRVLKVKGDESGLALGPAVQAKCEESGYNIGPGTAFQEAINLNNFRLQANGYYRLWGYFPFDAIGKDGLKVKLNFTVTPAWVGGIYLSGSNARGTLNFGLWTDPADEIASLEEESGNSDSIWLNAIIKAGASTGMMSAQFATTLSTGFIAVFSATRLKTMRLDT